jgi:hypothetical protein
MAASIVSRQARRGQGHPDATAPSGPKTRDEGRTCHTSIITRVAGQTNRRSGGSSRPRMLDAGPSSRMHAAVQGLYDKGEFQLSEHSRGESQCPDTLW